jgi:hypothetical protein
VQQDADTGIIICKLAPGQRILLSAVARMVCVTIARTLCCVGQFSCYGRSQGIGKIHAKFNPVATISMRQEPVIVLNRDLMEKLSVKASGIGYFVTCRLRMSSVHPLQDKKSFVRLCQPGVFRYNEATEQACCYDTHPRYLSTSRLQVEIVDAAGADNIDEIRKVSHDLRLA